jgi:hypothetical protein
VSAVRNGQTFRKINKQQTVGKHVLHCTVSYTERTGIAVMLQAPVREVLESNLGPRHRLFMLNEIILGLPQWPQANTGVEPRSGQGRFFQPPCQLNSPLNLPSEALRSGGRETPKKGATFQKLATVYAFTYNRH